MATDTTLIEKREELKRRLAAGEYKTLVDVFLEWLDRLLRKITRRSRPLPMWFIIVLLCFAIIGVSNIVAGRNLINTIKLHGLVPVLAVNLLNILYIPSVIVLNQSIRGIFTLWRNSILDATDSIASLEGFENWLKLTCNRRLHLIVIIIGGILNGLTLTMINPLTGVYTSYGWIFSVVVTAFLESMIVSAFLYLLLMLMLLLARMHGYDLRLFAADPSSSELISRLSGKFGFFLYFVAVYAAVLTLISTWSGFMSSFGINLVLFLWVPIIAIFILNQTSLSSIIRRAKWKTLNEAQAKVEKLQAAKNFGNQETMDGIKRLMDYHDRVKATRDSVLDFRTYLSFINSLLLPLLAFILGNLDFVLKLLGINP